MVNARKKRLEPSVMEFRYPHKRVSDDRASVAFRKYLQDPKTKAPGTSAFSREFNLYSYKEAL